MKIEANVPEWAPAFLKVAVAKLIESYRPDAIYLFGSHARGTSGPGSDVDLLLVVEDGADRARRGAHLACRILRPLR